MIKLLTADIPVSPHVGNSCRYIAFHITDISFSRLSYGRETTVNFRMLNGKNNIVGSIN
jgi:hypothetical protein